jgi:hypothetical protein
MMLEVLLILICPNHNVIAKSLKKDPIVAFVKQSIYNKKACSHLSQ